MLSQSKNLSFSQILWFKLSIQYFKKAQIFQSLKEHGVETRKMITLSEMALYALLIANNDTECSSLCVEDIVKILKIGTP